jgi:hypothetical protein
VRRIVPAPISEEEVQKIVSQMQEGTEKPTPQEWNLWWVSWFASKEGPFTDFNGTVEEVNYEKNQGPRVRHDLWSCDSRGAWNSVRSKRPKALFPLGAGPNESDCPPRLKVFSSTQILSDEESR